MNITLYTLTDAGIPADKARRILDMVSRYIEPHHVQLYRPVILKGRITTTTITMRAWKLKALDGLCEDRILNPRRSILANWLDLKRIVEAFKIKEVA
jgi:hypothetical protein